MVNTLSAADLQASLEAREAADRVVDAKETLAWEQRETRRAFRNYLAVVRGGESNGKEASEFDLGLEKIDEKLEELAKIKRNTPAGEITIGTPTGKVAHMVTADSIALPEGLRVDVDVDLLDENHYEMYYAIDNLDLLYIYVYGPIDNLAEILSKLNLVSF